MRWIEISVNTPSEEIDSLCARLTPLGVEGFIIETEEDFKNFLEHNHQYWDYVDEELENHFSGVSRIKFYLPDDDNGLATLKKVNAVCPELIISYIEDSDWENNWREFYKPLNIGSKLVVVPEWETVDDSERLQLRLDPGLIFGTGSHATTRMCLAELENYAAAGKKQLDLGCGSGILGIGGIILGADSSIGVDIDPKAPDVAAANAALNDIGEDRFKVYAGDIIGDKSMRAFLGTGYDIVLANIVSDVIIPLSAHVCGFMKDDGVFITSGIIEGRQDEVAAAIRSNGLKIIKHNCEEEWHCFVCVKE